MICNIYDVTAEDKNNNLINFEVVTNDFSSKTAWEYAKEYLGYLEKDINDLFVSSCQLCHSESLGHEMFNGREFFIRPIQGCR